MNENSLSRLYRRMTSSAQPTIEIDAASLVDAVSAETPSAATAQVLAKSSRHADLARMLRALRPQSEALAQDVGRRAAAHPLRIRETRPAFGARRGTQRPLRWAGGIAACLAVALGVGMWHGRQAEDWNTVVASAATAHLSDRIFTTRDEIFASSSDAAHRRHARGADQLFRANFSDG